MGKAAQGQMLALAHNLLTVAHARLEEHAGVVNEAEDRRRLQRQERLRAHARRHQRAISSLVLRPRRAALHSVKFIRWLRKALRKVSTVAQALPRLRAFYAQL